MNEAITNEKIKNQSFIQQWHQVYKKIYKTYYSKYERICKAQEKLK